MAGQQHLYQVTVQWQGSRESGTTGYRDYGREHQLSAPGKAPIDGSADPAFLGDHDRWNPEELLVGSLSACHKLWYLHLCAEAGVVVLAYEDHAEGEMDAALGRFTGVTLRPVITLSDDSSEALARELHEKAHEKCFIAASVNFEVGCEPTFARRDNSNA
ncbi:Organic hydroperoxide reductase OsmC/OhrA [Kushneria avicenniae]|uniref:Organic hydroperoxide reductase OsmC/OhrA n=1 Tax=Kushneria avicenniae TaxID=402385 RepID=A0A1I1LHB8_9GAMM|nr:OsmC family protein [Kushneria avicenniae]SFC72577.1 Organic hydroperoxide reductase OsmC/OhrA [Kushneria avicenniae]